MCLPVSTRRLVAFVVVSTLGCAPASGPTDDAFAVHEARITALEAQVRALQERLDASELATVAPLGEPPEDAWVLVDGAEWATNGHVLIRRDGPRPDASAVRPGWRRGMTPEEFVALMPIPSPNSTLTRLDTIDDNGTTVVRYRRDADGPPIHLDAAYATLLAARVVQGADPLGPVYALAEDGTAVAIVMPRMAPH